MVAPAQRYGFKRTLSLETSDSVDLMVRAKRGA
jgi:hypothetical protein